MRLDVEFGQEEGQDLKIVQAIWSQKWILIEDWKMSQPQVEEKMKKDRKNQNLYQENQCLCSKTIFTKSILPLNISFGVNELNNKECYIHGYVNFPLSRRVTFIPFLAKRIPKEETFDNFWIKFGVMLGMNMDEDNATKHFDGNRGD